MVAHALRCDALRCDPTQPTGIVRAARRTRALQQDGEGRHDVSQESACLNAVGSGCMSSNANCVQSRWERAACVHASIWGQHREAWLDTAYSRDRTQIDPNKVDCRQMDPVREHDCRASTPVDNFHLSFLGSLRELSLSLDNGRSAPAFLPATSETKCTRSANSDRSPQRLRKSE